MGTILVGNSLVESTERIVPFFLVAGSERYSKSFLVAGIERIRIGELLTWCWGRLQSLRPTSNGRRIAALRVLAADLVAAINASSTDGAGATARERDLAATDDTITCCDLPRTTIL